MRKPPISTLAVVFACAAALSLPAATAPAGTVTHVYDDLNRLVESREDSQIYFGYEYDEVGNRVTKTLDKDTDGDAVRDLLDADDDDDGIPDDVELGYGLSPLDPSDAALDLDADGLTNLAEYQLGTALDNPDTDADGLPDAYEVAHGFDPLDDGDLILDADSDGLANADEYLWGTDPLNPDTDGDHTNDGAEVAAGRNPLVNEPVIIVIVTSVVLGS